MSVTAMLDERLEVIELQVGLHHQHLRGRSQQRHRQQVPVGIVGQALVEVFVDRHRAISRNQQRMAVGGRLGDHLGADVAARAAAVFHHEGLPKRLLQALGKRAADDVGRRAGRVRNYDSDRLRGVRLGP